MTNETSEEVGMARRKSRMSGQANRTRRLSRGRVKTISGRTRSRGWTGVSAAIAAGLAVLAGALMLAGGPAPAGAGVSTWVSPTLETDFGSVGTGVEPVTYGVDDDGYIHLRGLTTGTDAPAARLGGTGGPWVSELFTLPCGSRPNNIIGQSILAYEPDHGLEAYSGIVYFLPTGEVMVGAFDVPIAPDGSGDQEMDISVSLEGITFVPKVETCT